MNYSIHQLSTLAGVTVRTLHHYDDIGLLTPDRSTVNSYRVYTRSDLLRLQQILFYRELSFPLDKIKQILDNPDFDYQHALESHRQVLVREKSRLASLIRTIDHTINNLKGASNMSDNKLYLGFSKKQQEEYQKEAETRWGNTNAYRESVANVKKMGKAGLQKINSERIRIEKELALLMDHDVLDTQVQELIRQHRANIGSFYQVTDTIYAGLAEMYISDPRFASHYDQVAPGLADFLSRAMHASLEK